MKSATDYLADANAVVPRLSVEDAIAKHEAGNSIFIDVRDSAMIAETGTIAGAVHIPRGFMEFAADDSTALHNPVLQKDADILLVCAAGGMAALAGKTLADMGYKNVSNIGGFKDWVEAGGKIES
ncbi:rhodanese-like domain-containing protein [Alphaproteobacteria bacterium]|nr:rhodanese-like domain-containing protein [Alphaproteobacteria bacterium]